MSKFQIFVYICRYKWYLFTHVPEMSLIQAIRYSTPFIEYMGDPIDDAKSEMSYMEP
jgi:hypothetical protein